MEENKKKKTTAAKGKQTTRSKNNPKKTTVKAATKKTTSKKIATKKVVGKKVTPKKEVKVKEEVNLEKTLIVDGLQKQNAEEVVKNLEKESIEFDKDVDEKSSTRITVVLILMIIITIGTVSFFVCKELKNDKKNDVKNDSNILEKINDNNVVITDNPEKAKEVDEATYPNIVNISLSEFEQKVLKKEKVNLLISKSTCSFCIEFEPVLNKVLDEQGKKVYRLNIYTMSKDEIDRFRGYYAFTKTPTIITIEDGILKSELVGSKNEETLKDWVKDNIL